MDIREIVKAEVLQSRNKVILASSLYLPVGMLIWIVPYVSGLKSIMTSPIIWNGNSIYVFLVFALSSIIQFYMGSHFYTSSYKSLKHKSANMDVLIVISTSSAWLYGVVLTLRGYT